MNLKVLGDGFVRLTKTLGSEIDIVNAARVSFKKEVTEISKKDIDLIQYLASEKHKSPFRHCFLSLHIKMPIFVMRQFVKHRVGVEINEMSGRYVEFEDNTYYVPKHFRFQSKTNKQGSAENLLDADNVRALLIYEHSCQQSFKAYRELLDMNVAKEMARMLLPLSIWTEIRVTMSLDAIQNFIALRDESHAQFEIREYAKAIKTVAINEFPNAMPIMLNN